MKNHWLRKRRQKEVLSKFKGKFQEAEPSNKSSYNRARLVMYYNIEKLTKKGRDHGIEGTEEVTEA